MGETETGRGGIEIRVDGAKSAGTTVFPLARHDFNQQQNKQETSQLK